MELIHTILLAPMREMFGVVMSYVPTLISVMMMLLLGLMFLKVFHDFLGWLFTEVKLDKMADTIGLSGVLQKGGVKAKLSDLILNVVHLVIVVMFLIMTAHLVGVSAVSVLLGTLVGYVPQILSAGFVLVLGLILAKIIASVVYTVVTMLDMPGGDLLEKISRWAMIIFTLKLSLEQLGFGYLLSGTIFHIWFAGLILALAIAFGLGGRDMASGYLAKKK